LTGQIIQIRFPRLFIAYIAYDMLIAYCFGYFGLREAFGR